MASFIWFRVSGDNQLRFLSTQGLQFVAQLVHPIQAQYPQTLQKLDVSAIKLHSLDGVCLGTTQRLDQLEVGTEENPIIVSTSEPTVSVPGVPADHSCDLAKDLGVPFETFPDGRKLSETLEVEFKRKIPIALQSVPVSLSSVFEASVTSLEYQEMSTIFYVAYKANPGTGTESNHHSLWDKLIKDPLEALATHNKGIALSFDRDAVDPSTATQDEKRPDLLCWLENTLVLKGEEKASDTEFNIAVEELTAKCNAWSPLFFGNLDYYFAYAAAGHKLRFHAIYKSRHMEAISPIFNLNNEVDRVKVVCCVVNIFRCLRHFLSRIPQTPPFKLFSVHKRANCEITFQATHVEKVIKNFHEYKYAKYQELLEVYKISQNSPNIIQADAGPNLQSVTYTVFLQPIGFHKYPESSEELKHCIREILTGLDILHAKGYVHRDIRWENILRKEDGGWMLIDLEHAGRAGPVSYRLAWWPKVGLKGYTPACDLYLLGTLVASLRSFTSDEGRQEFQKKLLSLDTRMRAQTLLREKYLVRNG